MFYFDFLLEVAKFMHRNKIGAQRWLKRAIWKSVAINLNLAKNNPILRKQKKNQYAEVMSHLQNTAENPDHNLLINEDSPD